MKILRCSRETNTNHVYQLDIGLDSPRFPGREVACSTRVAVTADVSTVTDTPSHSSSVTSQSRVIQLANDVITPREISWLFVAPPGDMVEPAQTGSGIKAETVCRDSEGAVLPVFRVSEAASSREILLDNDAPSGQTLNAVVPPLTGTGTSTCVGTQYPTVGTEFLTVGTNNPLRSFVTDSRNTAIVADAACNTGDWRDEVSWENTATHAGIMIDSRSVATNDMIPFISRRANSMPPSPEQLLRTNQGTGTCYDVRNAEQLASGMPNNIPDVETSATYQSTRPDGGQVAPEPVDYDNGHVTNRKQVPPIIRQLCTSCRRAMDELNAQVSGGGNSPPDQTNECIGGKGFWSDEERRRDFPELEFPAGLVRESIAVAYRDQAVGNDDGFFPAVEAGVGSGTVWTESRGTGDGSAWMVDAGTWTPAVVVVDRSSGTRSLRLVHKNEATDSQQTADVGTSPAEDITSAYRGLLAAVQPRPVTVNRGTATAPVAATIDRETTTEHRRLVDSGTSPAVDVTAAYRGLVGAKLTTGSRVTVSRGTLTAPLPTQPVDKDTITDCVMVDRASSPIKVYLRTVFLSSFLISAVYKYAVVQTEVNLEFRCIIWSVIYKNSKA